MESMESSAPAAVTSGSKKIGEYPRKGFTIVTWMNGADFFAEVHEAGTWKWGTALDGNRGRAERLAEEWIDEQAKAMEPPPAPASDPGEVLIGGWRIEVVDGRGGTYNAVISPVAEHVGGIDEPPAFRGYQREKQALDEATAWAQANPLRLAGWFNGCEWLVLRDAASEGAGWTFSVTFPVDDGAADVGVTDMFVGSIVYRTPDDATNEAIGWCSRFKLGEQLPAERSFAEVYPEPMVADPAPVVGGAEGVEAIDVAAAPASEPPVAPPAPVAPAQAQAPAPIPPAPAVEPPTVEPTPAETIVDEVWTLLEERKTLRRQRAGLLQDLEAAKADLKACDSRLESVNGRIDAALEDRPRQRPLPLAPAPKAPVLDAPKLAAEAKKVADKLQPPPRDAIEWAFNGRTHKIFVRELGPSRFRAVLFGMEDTTEGFAESWEQAVEASKSRASIVFADCDPGETTPKADAGPVADGPRLPPKRGRKPKLKGKSAAEVEAALRGAMTLDEAAKVIGCSTAELQGWAREADFTLSKFLGKDTGGDEPAPKASKKPRRGGKRGGK